MRTRARATIAGAVAVVAAASLAAPAHAYDVDRYVYAAGHMLRTSDVPKALGAFGDRMSFNANTGRLPLGLCSPKDSTVNLRGGNAYYSAFFSNGSDDGNTLSETVITYKSNEAAIKAFDKAKEAIAACVGTQSGSWSDPDGASTYTYSSTTTTGEVPSVTVTGVKSVFINTNHVDGSSTTSSKELRDSYLVMTLLGDAVIVTDYERANDSNVSTKLRKKVNQAAFNAVTRWAA